MPPDSPLFDGPVVEPLAPVKDKPTYRDVTPPKVRVPFLRRLWNGEVIDNLFFAGAAFCVVLLAVALFRQGAGSFNVSFLIGFWLALTYLALPRMNRILTSIYVPDYFIGRTRTGDGLLGDPVNIALLGEEHQIHAAMQRAGWVLADPINISSSLKITIGSVLKRSYPSAPVSNLFLFGRQQSFAYQQQVEGNPAQRHHVRFWSTPSGWLLPGGYRVDWLADGTYDRAVGLSMFTLQVTHKVDADTDIERDYVVDTMLYADSSLSGHVIKDFAQGYHSRNGGGDAIRTDGNLPVVDVSSVKGVDRHDQEPDDLVHQIGRRPLSLAVGTALLILATLLDFAYSLSKIDDTVRADTDVNGAVLTTAITITVVVVYAIIAFLLWKIYQGKDWARFGALGLTLMQVVGGLLQWLSVPADTLSFGALLTLVCRTLAVFALSSLSLRTWTERQS